MCPSFLSFTCFFHKKGCFSNLTQYILSMILAEKNLGSSHHASVVGALYYILLHSSRRYVSTYRVRVLTCWPAGGLSRKNMVYKKCLIVSTKIEHSVRYLISRVKKPGIRYSALGITFNPIMNVLLDKLLIIASHYSHFCGSK